MTFASVLNAYCNVLGCTNRELAEACDISSSALSRYRSGTRIPEMGSDVVERLVTGIAELSDLKTGETQWTQDAIRENFESSVEESTILGMSFGSRLNALMDLFGLRNAEVAQILDVSPSYISRIRNEQRMPADQRRFANSVSQLVALRSTTKGNTKELIELLDSAGNEIDTSGIDVNSTSEVAEVVEQWLLGNHVVKSDILAVEGLLEKLNKFYFNREFEQLRDLVPTSVEKNDAGSFSRFYYALEGMREAEFTYFEIAAANSASEVYISSDMPLLEMAISPDFMKRYRLAIGNIIQKGGHVTVIHSVERPISETVMAFDLWLPLYLTGQVTPYYLKGVNNRLFCHVNYVCESCALASEAVMGHQADGRYYLTTEPEELAYYQKKMSYIMEHVYSMLEIYRDDEPGQAEQFERLEQALKTSAGARIVGAGRYENLRIVSNPRNCATVTILCESPIHLVIRHPKLRYVISQIG